MPYGYDTPKKRSRLSQREKLARYQNDVQVARKEVEQLHKDWKRYIQIYQGNQWITRDGVDITPEDAATVNHVGPIINTILPSIATQPPKIRVRPLRPQDQETAPLVEAVLNYEWRRLDVTQQLRLATLDMLVLGTGWLKVGYEYREVEVERDPQEVEEEVQETLAGLREMVEGLPEEASAAPPPEYLGMSDEEIAEVEAQQQGQPVPLAELPPEMQPRIPTEDEIRAVVPTTKTVVEKDEIFVERVSPFDVLVDPEATSLDKARWICHKMIRPLEEVKADPRYKNTKGLKPSETLPVYQDMGYEKQTVKEYNERICIYEYYNLVDRTICVFAEGYDKELYSGPYEYPFDGGPFVMLTDYFVPDKLYGFGEVRMIEGLQMELNKIRTQMLNHGKNANAKILYDPTAFDDAGLAALRSNKNMAFVRVLNGRDLEKAALVLPTPQIPPDRYQLNNIVEGDITQVTGVSDYERGAFNSIRRTATEAAIIQDASTLKQRDKLDRVEKAATEVARKMKALIQLFYDRTRVILVTGEGGETWPQAYSKEDIEGEYDVAIDASSTVPINETMEIQKMERMLQLLAGFPEVNRVELLKEYFRKVGFTAGVERFFNPLALQAAQEGLDMTQLMTPQGVPGQQPGQAAGAIPSPQEREAAVAGGAEAAGVR